MRERKGVDLDGKGGGEKLWEVLGEKNIIRKYYGGKKLFSIKVEKGNFNMLSWIFYLKI